MELFLVSGIGPRWKKWVTCNTPLTFLSPDHQFMNYLSVTSPDQSLTVLVPSGTGQWWSYASLGPILWFSCQSMVLITMDSPQYQSWTLHWSSLTPPRSVLDSSVMSPGLVRVESMIITDQSLTDKSPNHQFMTKLSAQGPDQSLTVLGPSGTGQWWSWTQPWPVLDSSLIIMDSSLTTVKHAPKWFWSLVDHRQTILRRSWQSPYASVTGA